MKASQRTRPSVIFARTFAEADAIVICTPEYAGALPGALKNLLEWTVGDGGTLGEELANGETMP